MTGKNFIALALAVMVGILGFIVLKWVIAVVWGLGKLLIVAAIIGGIAWLAYRKFNNMLSSGKRLT